MFNSSILQLEAVHSNFSKALMSKSCLSPSEPWEHENGACWIPEREMLKSTLDQCLKQLGPWELGRYKTGQWELKLEMYSCSYTLGGGGRIHPAKSSCTKTGSQREGLKLININNCKQLLFMWASLRNMEIKTRGNSWRSSEWLLLDTKMERQRHLSRGASF